MRYGRKYRKKRGCYRPGNRKDQILWWHPDGMPLKGDFDPMGCQEERRIPRGYVKGEDVEGA